MSNDVFELDGKKYTVFGNNLIVYISPLAKLSETITIISSEHRDLWSQLNKGQITGKVAAVGNLVAEQKSRYPIEVGDTVLFRRYGGRDINLDHNGELPKDGTQIRIMDADELLGKIS